MPVVGGGSGGTAAAASATITTRSAVGVKKKVPSELQRARTRALYEADLDLRKRSFLGRLSLHMYQPQVRHSTRTRNLTAHA